MICKVEISSPSPRLCDKIVFHQKSKKIAKGDRDRERIQNITKLYYKIVSA